MSILITGANGAIGFDLVNLLSKYKKVYAISRTKKGNKKLKNVEWINHDLKKEIKLNIKSQLDCIVHCAVDQNFLNKSDKKYSRINLKIIKNVVNFAKKNNSKIIINFSSIEVYGNVKTKFLNERYKPVKPNIYGQTKLLIEKYLERTNLNFISLRLPGIFCKFQKNLNRPWLNNVLKRLKKNDEIVVYNGLNKFNNIIDSYQISKIILHIIKDKIKIKNFYNFASSQPIILFSLIKKLKSKMKSKSNIVNLKDNNKVSFYISVKKLEKKYGFSLAPTKKLVYNHLKNFK
mgnify:CR=1 FL=1|jgi:nucleoside-diphosphate-sugar epimerase|tara:strand:- start:927 stop:1796 length:870 start_codon:yes stop_codon:yes gene_type:complete